ncbi:MAG: hypothetical protein KGL94_06940 [Acidobacteriota bacterium]|nr:hypothetical protein [Acidobacteriota bacterium]
MPLSGNPADETKRVQLPPSETGPVPVAISRAEPRWFGVPPPLLLLGLALGACVAAIACFAAASWPAGLVLLGLSAMFAALFLEVARRRPDSTLTQTSSEAALTARSWASSRFELLRARSSAIAESQRVLGARAVIESERRTAQLRLGEALRSDDEEAAAAARERLAALDRAEAALAGRVQARRAQADERIRRVHLAMQETMIVSPRPEPYPPPDEGDPPVPAPVPEPSPERGADTRRPAA